MANRAMEEKHSSGITEFQIKIDEVTKNLENSHRSALRKVRTLKEKMNVLELKLGEKRSDGPKEDLDELNSAGEKLNRLTDALISESAKAWEEYKKFEHECKTHHYETVEMNDLKTICKEKEELAKDLLCFSLGHLKRRSE